MNFVKRTVDSRKEARAESSLPYHRKEESHKSKGSWSLKKILSYIDPRRFSRKVDDDDRLSESEDEGEAPRSAPITPASTLAQRGDELSTQAQSSQQVQNSQQAESSQQSSFHIPGSFGTQSLALPAAQAQVPLPPLQVSVPRVSMRLPLRQTASQILSELQAKGELNPEVIEYLKRKGDERLGDIELAGVKAKSSVGKGYIPSNARMPPEKEDLGFKSFDWRKAAAEKAEREEKEAQARATQMLPYNPNGPVCILGGLTVEEQIQQGFWKPPETWYSKKAASGSESKRAGNNDGPSKSAPSVLDSQRSIYERMNSLYGLPPDAFPDLPPRPRPAGSNLPGESSRSTEAARIAAAVLAADQPVGQYVLSPDDPFGRLMGRQLHQYPNKYRVIAALPKPRTPKQRFIEGHRSEKRRQREAAEAAAKAAAEAAAGAPAAEAPSAEAQERPPTMQEIIESTVPKGSKRSRPPPELLTSDRNAAAPEADEIIILTEEAEEEEDRPALKKRKTTADRVASRVERAKSVAVTVEEIDNVPASGEELGYMQPSEVVEPETYSRSTSPTDASSSDTSAGSSQTSKGEPSKGLGYAALKSTAPKEPSKLRYSIQAEPEEEENENETVSAATSASPLPALETTPAAAAELTPAPSASLPFPPASSTATSPASTPAPSEPAAALAPISVPSAITSVPSTAIAAISVPQAESALPAREHLDDSKSVAKACAPSELPQYRFIPLLPELPPLARLDSMQAATDVEDAALPKFDFPGSLVASCPLPGC
ncbi:uncharacterized protein LAESUDRAFT_756247 [Laetiporus sulphureus 93-53]|uniref:Uncharacterized protein n=1 Tax=Laetiporus sulphureus 93-53 TaxID=1314785 RepID=A0A165G9Y4_9APHY|nr:uncharacterized protein LAESUDRAFT_756247 [Laetiporus sulphureus 93-53]KZT10045.1 hypothetical protein LAESUDRAFT_756247 [Laetiporus sulphureus 93-53]